MRTVLLLHSSAGHYGADRQLRLLATGLDGQRYRALVVLSERGELELDLRREGVEVLIRPLSVLRRALLTPGGVARVVARSVSDARVLGALARAHNVDIVHSNTSVILGGAAAARRLGVPHVWHVREIYAAFAGWWPAYRHLLLSADALPCVSWAARAPFGVRARAALRTRVLPDGLALAPDSSGLPAGSGAASRAAARARLGLSEEVFVCAVLGRLSAWKGQDILLRALAHPAAPPGSVGLIAGDPWPGQEAPAQALHELAARLGLVQRARFLGFVDDPQTLYAASDVVAVPSTLPDPLPNSALEAAAAGCCVVASAHGGLPEIVTDGQTGRLVAPGDPAQLARVLGELAAAPEQRARLAAAAAADVGRRFSRERLLAGVQGLYDELLSR